VSVERSILLIDLSVNEKKTGLWVYQSASKVGTIVDVAEIDVSINSVMPHDLSDFQRERDKRMDMMRCWVQMR
jgi:hypothetical protein